jgi:hypothetical protein
MISVKKYEIIHFDMPKKELMMAIGRAFLDAKRLDGIPIITDLTPFRLNIEVFKEGCVND